MNAITRSAALLGLGLFLGHSTRIGGQDAAGAAPPETRPETRKFPVGELRDLELDAVEGHLHFRADDTRFVYAPDSNDNAVKTVACTRILAELRLAAGIELTVDTPTRSDMSIIKRLVLHYPMVR